MSKIWVDVWLIKVPQWSFKRLRACKRFQNLISHNNYIQQGYIMKGVDDTYGGLNGLTRDRGEATSLINDRVYNTNGTRRLRTRLITPTDLLRTRITPVSILSRCI